MRTFALFMLSVLVNTAVALGILALALPPRPSVQPPSTDIPSQPPGARVILVGVIPDGTRVYRIEGPDMIVPAVVAVSPKGEVAFR